MSREALSEISQQNTMDLVTKMGEDQKQELRDILSDGLKEGKGMRDIAQEMEEKVDGMSRTRAQAIARTETTRAKNLANLYKYKDKGFQSFTVDFTSEACDDCVEAYENIVFPIEAVEMLPPRHTHCMCVAIFHPETAEEYADKYGYDIYEGSGGEEENEITEFADDEIYDYAYENLMEQYEQFWDGDSLTELGQYLSDYKNTEWFEYVNEFLRGKKLEDVDLDLLKKQIAEFNKAFTNTAIDRDILSYRAVTNIFEGNKVGDVIPWKGFMSTTTDLDYATQRVDALVGEGKDAYMMRIIIPKGTEGIQVETALKGNVSRNEFEWLMKDGTNIKFTQIDRVNKYIEAIVMDNKIY